MRRAPAGRAHHVARFPFEFVRLPIDSVRAPLNHNFAAVLRHHAKKSIAISDPKWLNLFVKKRERARPLRFRLERAENEPRVQRQGHDDHRNRAVHRESLANRWGDDSACLSIRLEGVAPSAPHRVIDQQQTKRDREQIEKTVIAGHRDRDLQEDHQAACDQP